MSQFMRRIVAACAFVGLMASVAPASFAAYTEQSAANELASQGIIVDQSATPSDYRTGQNILRQEAVGIAGRVKGVSYYDDVAAVIPTSDPADYNCQGVYTDTPEKWVCRAFEQSAEERIVDPVATGRKANPTRDVTRYEAMVMMMKAVCINPAISGEGATHVEQTADAAAKFGVIASAASFDPNRAATRGEVFVYAAELIDYAAAHPAELDSSLPGCSDEGGIDLCDLLPELPGCSNTVDPENPDVTYDANVSVSLSEDTPAEQDIPRNVSRVTYTCVTLSNDDVTDAEVNEIWIERQGLGSKDNFGDVWLSVDGVRVSNTKTINSDDEARFTGLNMVVEAGEDVEVCVDAQMDIAAGNNTTFKNRLVVTAVATDAGAATGTPVVGNYMRTTDYDVAKVDFDNTVSSGASVEVGDENVVLGEFKLSVDSANNRNVEVAAIRLENTGSADLEDLDNLAVYINGDKVSTDVYINGDFVTFVFANVVVEDGDNEKFEIRADILRGEDNDTYEFALDKDYDLVAYEESTSFGVEVTNSANCGNGLCVYTVDAGRFNISLDVSSPNSEEYIAGTEDVVALVAKIDTATDVNVDGVKVWVTPVGFTGTEALLEADINDTQLLLNGSVIDSEDNIQVSGGNFYLEFDSSFTLSDNDLLTLQIDLDDDAVSGHKYTFKINITDFDDPEYADSGDNVDSTDMSGSATSRSVEIVTATASIYRNDGYSNETFVAGSNDQQLLRFAVSAGTASDVTLDRLVFQASYSNSSCTYSDFTNLQLYADGVQVGDTEDVTSGNRIAFEDLNVDIMENDEAQFILVGDIDTGAGPCVITLNIVDYTMDNANGDDAYFNTDTGNDGTINVTPFSDNLQISEGGQLTVLLNSESPDSAVLVASTSGNTVGTWDLGAEDDDIRVNELWFANNATYDGGTAATNDVDTVAVTYTAPTFPTTYSNVVTVNSVQNNTDYTLNITSPAITCTVLPVKYTSDGDATASEILSGLKTVFDSTCTVTGGSTLTTNGSQLTIANSGWTTAGDALAAVTVSSNLTESETSSVGTVTQSVTYTVATGTSGAASYPVSITIANTDTTATIAAKVATALASAVPSSISASVSGTNVVLTGADNVICTTSGDTTATSSANITLAPSCVSGAAATSGILTSTTQCDARIATAKLVVDGVTVDTAPVDGTGILHFDVSSSALTIAKDEEQSISVVLDFNSITDESQTGCVFRYSLYNVEAESASTSFDLDNADIFLDGTALAVSPTVANGVYADDFQIARTVPTLTLVSSTTGSLINGTNTLYSVKVTADSARSVGVYSLSFTVDASGSAAVSNVQLADTASVISDYTCSPNTVAANTTAQITCTATGTPLQVAAGSSKTFSLKGVVAGAASGDSVTTQMVEYDPNLFNQPTPAAGAQTPSAIVWSDNSGTSGSVTDAQWFIDAELRDLDLAARALEKNS